MEASDFKKTEGSGIVLVASDTLTLGEISVKVGATSGTTSVTA